jgi:hypothetical protein
MPARVAGIHVFLTTFDDKAWMVGISLSTVMPALVAGIHVFSFSRSEK